MLLLITYYTVVEVFCNCKTANEVRVTIFIRKFLAWV